MKALITMMAAGATYVLGVILITGYGWIFHWREKRHIQHKNRLLEHLLQLLSTGELHQTQIHYRHDDLREALVAVCKLVSGSMIDRARLLYEDLGFMQEDIRILKRSGNRSAKIRTLMRLRLLRADLPHDLWMRLIQHRSTPIRWVAMEAYIIARGQGALSALFGYAQKPDNERLGVLVHLFSLYATSNSAGLLTILDDPATGEIAQIALLTTLRYYPNPGAESSILAALKRSFNIELQRRALEALKPYSSDSIMEVLLRFSFHQDPLIKQAVAYALSDNESGTGMEILAVLTLDMSHAVRRQAIESLCSMYPHSETILDPIRQDQDHPAHELLVIREETQAKAA